MEQQAQYMREGLNETRKAADAARNSADTAEQALMIANRGWLMISDFNVSNLTPNGVATISFRVINAGATPVTFHHADCLSRIDSSLPDDPDYRERVEVEQPQAVFGPGEFKTLSHPTRVIPSVDFMKLPTGERTIFVFGRLVYTDVFGHHSTGYLVMLDRDRHTFKHVPSKPNYIYAD